MNTIAIKILVVGLIVCNFMTNGPCSLFCFSIILCARLTFSFTAIAVAV